MNEKQWKNKIKRAATEAGTYKPVFDPAIDALAKILVQRDAVYQQYLDEGAVPIVERTSDRGAVNSAKNPLISLWNDLNGMALSYWKELGLTPASLKKINEAAMDKKPTGGSALETALLRLSDGA